MYSVTVSEAEANLADLLGRVQQGEEVIITSDSESKPVARLLPVEPSLEKRRIGFLEGQGSIGPEFFEPLPEDELRLWNGEGE
jgi:prevent-host-death family protein